MRHIALAVGVSIAGAAIMQTASPVYANPAEPAQIKIAAMQDDKTSYAEKIKIAEVKKAEAKEAANEDPEPKVYKVKQGDTLTKIARENDSTWTRLWQKNKDIKHPDKIQVNDKIVVPLADEELEERAFSESSHVVNNGNSAGSSSHTVAERNNSAGSSSHTSAERSEPVGSSSHTAAERNQASNRSQSTNNNSSTRSQSRPTPQPARATTQQPVVSQRGSNGPNLYTAGYCTWYAKDRRPDLPGNLGNANTWAVRAQAQGIPTGSQPRAGAIGVSTAGPYGHVVYVESVNSNGSVNISEMNWRGLYVVSSRTVPGNSFTYIY